MLVVSPLIGAERVALQQVLMLAIEALHLGADRVQRDLVREGLDVLERQKEDGVLLEMLTRRRVAPDGEILEQRGEDLVAFPEEIREGG
ncbi:hypothetical protein WME79_08820 [Sorangium sp. So ce726]